MERDMSEEYKKNIPVSVKDQNRLAELEVIVTKNFKAFYEVGCALREIREKRYYRQAHNTFEDYCREMWDILERSANFQIKAANVVDNLQLKLGEANHGTIVPGLGLSENSNQTIPLPENEHQARILSRVPPEDQPSVWVEAVKTIPEGGKITASHIKKTMREMNLASMSAVRKEVTETDMGKKGDDIKDDRVSKKFKSSFTDFFDQVQKERQHNWRYTDKKVVLRFLKAIYTTVNSEI